MPVYLIFTRSYGILQKTDDNIAAARAWATRALPGETTQVLRTTASVNIAELEALIPPAVGNAAQPGVSQ
jgi:hypothetical protein